MVKFSCKEAIGGITYYYCYVEYKGTQYYENQTVKANKGDTLKVKYNVYGESDGGHIAVQIWDWKNSEQISWKEYDLNPYESKADYVEFEADKNREIGLVLYKYDGAWSQIDYFGNWTIEVIIPACSITSLTSEVSYNILKLYATFSGPAGATCTADLYIDGTKVSSKLFTVRTDGLGYATFEYDTSRLSEGTHTAKVCTGDSCKSVTFEITKPTIVTEITISVKTDILYDIGSPVRVDYTATNLVGKTICLFVDDVCVEELTLATDVAPGVFWWIADSPGNHRIKVCTKDKSVCSDEVVISVADIPAYDKLTEYIINDLKERWLSEFGTMVEARFNGKTDVDPYIEEHVKQVLGLDAKSLYETFFGNLGEYLTGIEEKLFEHAVYPIVEALYNNTDLKNLTTNFVNYWSNKLRDNFTEDELRSMTLDAIRYICDQLAVDVPEYPDYPISTTSFKPGVWAVFASFLKSAVAYAAVALGTMSLLQWFIWSMIDNVKMSYWQRMNDLESHGKWAELWNYVNKDYQAYLLTILMFIIIQAVIGAILTAAMAIRLLKEPSFSKFDPATQSIIKNSLLTAEKLGRAGAVAFVGAINAIFVINNLVVFMNYQSEGESWRRKAAWHLGIDPWTKDIPVTSFVEKGLNNPIRTPPSSDDFGIVKIYTNPKGGIVFVWEDNMWKLASFESNPAYIVYKSGTHKFRIHLLDWKGQIYEWEGYIDIPSCGGKPLDQCEVKEITINLIEKSAFLPSGESSARILQTSDTDPLVLALEYDERTAYVRLAGLESTRLYSSGFQCSMCGWIGKAHDEWIYTGKEFLPFILDMANTALSAVTRDVTVKIDSYAEGMISNESKTLPLAVVIDKNGANVNIKYIQQGAACYNSNYSNRYVNEDEFRKAQLSAIQNKAGMWAYLVDKYCRQVGININMSPSGKIYIDRKLIS